MKLYQIYGCLVIHYLLYSRDLLPVTMTHQHIETMVCRNYTGICVIPISVSKTNIELIIVFYQLNGTVEVLICSNSFYITLQSDSSILIL